MSINYLLAILYSTDQLPALQPQLTACMQESCADVVIVLDYLAWREAREEGLGIEVAIECATISQARLDANIKMSSVKGIFIDPFVERISPFAQQFVVRKAELHNVPVYRAPDLRHRAA